MNSVPVVSPELPDPNARLKLNIPFSGGLNNESGSLEDQIKRINVLGGSLGDEGAPLLEAVQTTGLAPVQAPA